MILKKNTVLEILFLIINPFVSIFFIVRGISLKKKSSFLFLSIFLSLLAFLYVPDSQEDLVRHYEKFKNLNSNLRFFIFKKDVYLENLITILKYLNLKKEFIPGITVFIGYYLISTIFFDIAKEKKNYLKKFLLFFMGIISFKVLALGIRSGLATIIFGFGVYNLGENKNKIGWLFLILSSSIHFSLIIFLLPIFFIKYLNINLKFYYSIFYITLIIGVIISPSMVNKTLDYLNVGIDKKIIDTYTMGYWAKDYSENISFKGRIAERVLETKYIFLYFYLFWGKMKDTFFNRITIVCFSIVNLFINLSIIYGRYMMVINFLMFIYIFSEIDLQLEKLKIKVLNKLIRYGFILIILINVLIEIYSQKGSYFKSYKYLYVHNIISIFFEEVEPEEYIIKGGK